jgi:hypothetical protein
MMNLQRKSASQHTQVTHINRYANCVTLFMVINHHLKTADLKQVHFCLPILWITRCNTFSDSHHVALRTVVGCNTVLMVIKTQNCTSQLDHTIFGCERRSAHTLLLGVGHSLFHSAQCCVFNHQSAIFESNAADAPTARLGCMGDPVTQLVIVVLVPLPLLLRAMAGGVGVSVRDVLVIVALVADDDGDAVAPDWSVTITVGGAIVDVVDVADVDNDADCDGFADDTNVASSWSFSLSPPFSTNTATST